MRKLASVQVIKDLTPILNADKIETAHVLGWEAVVKKGEYKVGDKCVYIEIDSLLPEDNPAFDFLKNSKGKIERIRTKRLRGQISQGLVMPMSILPKDYEVGDDVTDVLNIKKWEPDLWNRPTNKQVDRLIRKYNGKWANLLLYNKPWTNLFRKRLFIQAAKSFPSFIFKTDETRVQALPDVVSFYAGTNCAVTEKMDGSSITIWFDDKVKMHVASRNMEILDKSNPFWKAVIENEVERKIRSCFASNEDSLQWFCLQGELCGPKIQGNKYKFKSKRIFFFNIMYCNPVRFLGLTELFDLVTRCGLETVPILDMHYKLPSDVPKIVDLSKGKSVYGDTQREGIVIRPEPPIIDHNGFQGMVGNRVSFKAINPEFLLDYKL